MLELFDRSRQRTAIAENAYSISETTRLNSVSGLTFTLPDTDPKNTFCEPFCYVRQDGGELYRIMPEALHAEETGSITYQCEHVLATLIDNVMPGYCVIGGAGIYTEEILRFLLEKQHVKNWVLAECDFHYQFEYGWESEGLLAALFSVATPFAEPYRWETDTSVYPWRLSLKRLNLSGHPELYVRYRHNMMRLERKKDTQQVITRLYPLGYGEGVNQLTIKEVNGGVPYLQSPPEVVAKYGLIEKVWIDRRYENAESLKAAASVLLAKLQEPPVTCEVGLLELQGGTAEPGKRVRILYPESGESVDTWITEVVRDFGDLRQCTVTLANGSADVASQIADLADRQRIEQAYAQGATQVYAQALQANGSPSNGVTMDFFLPAELRIVNRVLAKIRMGQFRAYSKTTETVTQKVRTDYNEGETFTTTDGGGGTFQTSLYDRNAVGHDPLWTSLDALGSRADPRTAYGIVTGYGVEYGSVAFRDTTTSSADNSSPHTHDVPFKPHYHTIETNHRHSISGRHSHTITTANHTHSFTMPPHNHQFTIPPHFHSLEVPGHSHGITPGIYPFGNPQSFTIYLNGVRKKVVAGQEAELDITDLLSGADGKIPREKWMTLEIRPNDLAYVSIVLMVQGFIQSRGENNA